MVAILAYAVDRNWAGPVFVIGNFTAEHFDVYFNDIQMVFVVLVFAGRRTLYILGLLVLFQFSWTAYKLVNGITNEHVVFNSW